MLTKLKGLLEQKDGEIEGIASTSHPDRDGEIIVQEGWDLKNFKKNPVIMANHSYHEFPIGKASNIRVENNELRFNLMFSDATEKAREASQLVKEGILKSFSVGFIPRKRNDKDSNIIEEAELLEISLVSIPANPKAVVVAKSMTDNSFAKEIIKEWLLDENLKKEVDEEEKKEVCLCDKCKKEIKNTSEIVVKGDKENGEEGGGDSKAVELDQKLIQKVTGNLQQLCKQLKEKGGAEK